MLTAAEAAAKEKRRLEHGSPLACVHCALSPLAHAHGIGCSNYTARTAPRYGASCTVPGCECTGGYCPREED